MEDKPKVAKEEKNEAETDPNGVNMKDLTFTSVENLPIYFKYLKLNFEMKTTELTVDLGLEKLKLALGTCELVAELSRDGVEL